MADRIEHPPGVLSLEDTIAKLEEAQTQWERGIRGPLEHEVEESSYWWLLELRRRCLDFMGREGQG